MPNYNEMYYKLFNKITDVITELQEVQKLTEEMYILATMSSDEFEKGQKITPLSYEKGKI